jgi:hypothetical protein
MTVVLAGLWEGRCPANECGRRCKGKLMCTSHWRLVPHDARSALYEAFARFRREHSEAASDEILEASSRCVHAAEVHERG